MTEPNKDMRGGKEKTDFGLLYQQAYENLARAKVKGDRDKYATGLIVLTDVMRQEVFETQKSGGDLSNTLNEWVNEAVYTVMTNNGSTRAGNGEDVVFLSRTLTNQGSAHRYEAREVSMECAGGVVEWVNDRGGGFIEATYSYGGPPVRDRVGRQMSYARVLTSVHGLTVEEIKAPQGPDDIVLPTFQVGDLDSKRVD